MTSVVPVIFAPTRHYMNESYLLNCIYFLDIDECQRPGACGTNAICQNYPGNYTCACKVGYTGNPFDGVSCHC